MACFPTASFSVRTFFSLALALVPSIATAAIVPGEVIVQQGDAVSGTAAVVSDMRAPFVESGGTVAFTGALSDGDQFVWRDDQVIWLGSTEMTVALGQAESSMGTNAAGAFVYAPLIDGLSGLYTDQGVFALQGQPAVGMPPGFLSTFHQSPTMVDNGTIWWITGADDTGTGVTQSMQLVRQPTAPAGPPEIMLASGDMIDGLVIAGQDGIDTDYQVSRNGLVLIAVLRMDIAPSSDSVVYANGDLIAIESGVAAGTELWSRFDLVAINDSGQHAFSAATNEVPGLDTVIAYDGVIFVREGSTLDGIALAEPADVRMLAVDEHGRLAHTWHYGAGEETVFFSCSPQGLGSTTAVISVGDELDLDGDGTGDGLFINDILSNTGEPGRAIGDDGAIYIDVELGTPGGPVEAMIRVYGNCCGDGIVDALEACDDGNDDDTDDCTSTCEVASCGDGFVQAGVEACDDANADDTDACLSTCEAASCGDGFVQAGVETCDDANADDTDECLSTCESASCGDGFVQAGVETCDDGDLDNTNDCLDTCVPASCGDGFVWAGMEECDDGDADNTNDCLDTCVAATCGDGFVHDGVELCDDGNDSDEDECLNICAPASCGDGFVNVGVEECDDGNDDNTDECLNTCIAGVCGDGFINYKFENCDDGNDDDTDTCLSNCEFAECGDGFVREGSEECDDGNDDDTDACLGTCREASCGDGIVWDGNEECDDGNRDDGDECANDCTVNVPDPDTGNGEGDESTGDGGVDDSTSGAVSDGGSDSGSGSGSDTGGVGTVGGVGGGGCSCRSGENGSPWTGAGFGLLVLGAVTRRRRRRA